MESELTYSCTLMIWYFFCEEVSHLQELVNICERWFDRWKMKMSETKSQIVYFRPKGLDCPVIDIRYKGHPLKIVPNYKYLGVILDEFLSFQNHLENKTVKGHKALSLLISKSKQCDGFGYLTYSKLLETCIFSVLDYGNCCIPTNTVKKYKDEVLLRAQRYFLGVNKFTTIAFLRNELPFLEYCDRALLSKCRYYNRLVKQQEGRLSKEILKKMYNEKDNTWLSDLKSCINDLFNKESIDVMKVKEMLMQKYQNRVSVDIAAKKKLDWYKLYMNPGQICQINYRPHRSVTSKLFAGCLKLQIELDRYRGTAREARVCKLCEQGEVESNSHFLWKCVKLKEERAELISYLKLDENVDNSQKCKCLSENLDDKLAKLIYNLWLARNSKLYRK